jgi:hypothetical protein
MPSPLIDDETKKIIIQKTWCHGQAVAPVYGIICLWWYLQNGYQPPQLLVASFFLPYWCYLSYRSIFIEFSYKTIVIGGALAELSHVLVFTVTIQALDKTMHLLMCIASILFFVETAAFLAVVTAFRPRTSETANSSSALPSYQNANEVANML